MMTEKLKISIIVPVYNAEDYLDECIHSVFSQTHRPLQLIIVNDGSSDGTVQKIRLLEGECPAGISLELISHSASRGVSASRNHGAAAAEGDYLYFIDSDDWIEKHTLEQLLLQAQAYDADVTCGTGEYYSSKKDRWLDPKTADADHFYENNEEVLAAYCNGKIPVFIWNKLIRHDFFRESGLHFEESLLQDEDQLWCFRLMCCTNRMFTGAQVTYHYRQNNPNSITSGSYIARRLNIYLRILGFMQEDVRRVPEVGTGQNKRLVAKAVFIFIKSILWHLENDPDADLKKLYAVFQQQNFISPRSRFFPLLPLRDRIIAWGISLPYPLCRMSSPYYLTKVAGRFQGSA